MTTSELCVKKSTENLPKKTLFNFADICKSELRDGEVVLSDDASGTAPHVNSCLT